MKKKTVSFADNLLKKQTTNLKYSVIDYLSQRLISFYLYILSNIVLTELKYSLANIYHPNISYVLSSSTGRLIFRVLSAASHSYPEHQSSGGYSWGNNVLVRGSRSACRQSQGGYDMSHRQPLLQQDWAH